MLEQGNEENLQGSGPRGLEFGTCGLAYWLRLKSWFSSHSSKIIPNSLMVLLTFKWHLIINSSVFESCSLLQSLNPIITRGMFILAWGGLQTPTNFILKCLEFSCQDFFFVVQTVVPDIQLYPVFCPSSAKSMEEMKRLLLLILGCAVQVTHAQTHSFSREMCVSSVLHVWAQVLFVCSEEVQGGTGCGRGFRI